MQIAFYQDLHKAVAEGAIISGEFFLTDNKKTAELQSGRIHTAGFILF